MKSFLLIDDHVVVRSGIKSMLSEIFKPVEIFEAETGKKALQLLKENTVEIVILDVHIPGTDTLELVQQIKETFPSTKVLMFSMSAEKIHAPRYLKSGARGFVSKESSMEELLKAINIVSEGRRYISDSLAMLLAESPDTVKEQNPFSNLSPREMEIATLLLDGKTAGEISKMLKLGASTIGTHKARMFEKLGISNLLQLKEIAEVYQL